jgi:hypothetical protein
MLSEFDFEVIHKPGVDNEMDCLRMFPRADCHDSTGVRQEGDLEESAVPTWPAASCLVWAGGGRQLWGVGTGISLAATGVPGQTGLRAAASGLRERGQARWRHWGLG